MIKDIEKKSTALGVWGKVLNFPLILAPIGFFSYKIVWIIFICNLIAVLIAGQIHKKKPFSRLTSICHLAWIPIFPFLYFQIIDLDENMFFNTWLIFITLTISLSTILDIYNLFLYFKGNDSEIASKM